MLTHDNAHQASQHLCDRLFGELRARLGDVTRNVAGGVCSIGRQSAARTVYVYHHKTPSIRVYFRGSPDEAPEESINAPPAIGLRTRPKFKDSWERRFPFFFDLDDPSVVVDAAAFLAGRRQMATDTPKPTKGRPSREQRAADIWSVLASRASEKATITYAALAAAVGTHHRSLGRPLGLIQDYCLSEGLPPLTIVVVHASDARPGVGFTAWDSDNATGIALVHSMDWAALRNPFEYARAGMTIDNLAERLVHDPASATTVYQLVKLRGVAQVIFRTALFDAYGGACAFCGLSFVEALDAAHIHPWALCSLTDRMNVRNGLLLCSNHHRMFDNRWLLVTEDYRIHYADMELEDGPYSPMDRAFGPDLHGRRIRLPRNEQLWPNPELIRKRNKKP